MTITVDLGLAVKWLVAALFAGVGAFIAVMLVIKVRHFFASLRFARTDREALRCRWREIENLLRSEGEMSRKMAVIEADKLLDLALKTLAMPGETLGERLKYAAYKYPRITRVWWAHRVRNQLAHESTFHLDAGVASKAVREFRAALEMLGAI